MLLSNTKFLENHSAGWVASSALNDLRRPLRRRARLVAASESLHIVATFTTNPGGLGEAQLHASSSRPLDPLLHYKSGPFVHRETVRIRLNQVPTIRCWILQIRTTNPIRPYAGLYKSPILAEPTNAGLMLAPCILNLSTLSKAFFLLPFLLPPSEPRVPIAHCPPPTHTYTHRRFSPTSLQIPTPSSGFSSVPAYSIYATG